VQRERGRQVRQVIGHGRPRSSDALPRRWHAVGLQCHLAVVGIVLLRPSAVEVHPADAREILVDLQRTGSEVGANHGEVHLLKYVARTERGSHRCCRLSVYLTASVFTDKSENAYLQHRSSVDGTTHVRDRRCDCYGKLKNAIQDGCVDFV